MNGELEGSIGSHAYRNSAFRGTSRGTPARNYADAGRAEFRLEADHEAVHAFVDNGLAVLPENEHALSPDDPSIRTEIEVGPDRCTFLIGRAAMSARRTEFIPSPAGNTTSEGFFLPIDSKSKAFSAYVGWNEVTGTAAVDSFVSQRATDREFLGYGVAMTLDTSQNINHNGHELNTPTGITTPVPMMNKVTYTALERNLSNTRVIRLPDDVLMGSVSINIVTGNSAGPISDPMYPILHPAYTRLEAVYHPSGATGWLNTVNVTESQEYFTRVWHAMAQDRANTANYLEGHQFSSFGINLLSTQSAPGDFEDLVGQGTTGEPMLLTVGGLAAEFTLGFVPGYDVIDAVSYGLIKPVFDGEDDLGNYGVAAASTLGLMADAGYLAGPVGLLTNAATSSVKVCVKFVNKIGSPWLKRMLSTSDTLRGSLQDALDYMAKHLDGQPTEFAIEYVGAWTDWAVRTATSFINGSRRCAYPAYAVLKANSSNWQAATMAAYRRVSTSAIGDTATHGWAFVARRMSQLQNLGEFEIRIVKLRGSLSNTASEAQKLAADQAMKRVGDAVEATVRSAASNPGPSIRSVDDAISNIDRVPTGHLRALTMSHIGPGKAFATVEEFEALRVLPVQNLGDAQRNALRAIREGVIAVGVGMPIKKILSVTEATSRLGTGDASFKGFFVRAQDVAGANSAGELSRRLRTDYNRSSFFDSEPFVELETVADAGIAARAKVPMHDSVAGSPPPAGVLIHGDPPPYTGNGFTGSLDGHLTPEFVVSRNNPATLQPGVTIMRFKNADGSPRSISLGAAGASDRWVLRARDPSDLSRGYFWEPLP